MNKNIIPGLVSFDTGLGHLSGCYISADFDAYPEVDQPNPFHYVLSVEKGMTFPRAYQFRHQYFFKSGGTWYYDRRLPLGAGLKFSYDASSVTFRFNEMLKLLPFGVGGMLPAGGHLSDMIALDLILSGFVLLRGCAMAFGEKAVCVVGPGFNGKTSLLSCSIEQGARYVADELLVLDVERKLVFPVSLAGNLGRSANMRLRRDFKDGSKAVARPVPIAEFFRIQNESGRQSGTPSPDKGLLDYLYMLSLSEFYDSPFVTAYVAEEGLTDELFARFDALRNLDWEFTFVRVRDYDFSELLQRVRKTGLSGGGGAGS
jgi:hypothetical protein